MTLLDRVRALLTAQHADHALIGAAAMAVHGVSRATFDQDLLVIDRNVLTPHFWTPIGPDVTVDVRIGDADDPLAGVVRLTLVPDRDVDVIAGRHRWQEAILERAIRVGKERLPVADPADLILLKLYAGGSQDRWDIEQLLALHPSLVEAVGQRVNDLPLRSRELWIALRPGR